MQGLDKTKEPISKDVRDCKMCFRYTKSERDFSSAGLTITDNRANLNPQHVNELLVIRDALKKA